MSEINAPVLDLHGISRTFPGVKALKGVDFRLLPGEIHALMGQNGAGKSTLIKVMTGVYKPESGTMRLAGQDIRPSTPLDAQNLGISTVYQEVNLCPNLSVAENILIGREPRHLWGIDWRKGQQMARSILKDKLGLDLDVSRVLSTYPIAIQQMVSIARALFISSRVLILDEPTSSLDEHEVKALFTVLRKLKSEGLAILFVTHFLDQTYEISDRITVLRNGECVGEYLAADLPRLALIAHMTGKEIKDLENLPRIRRTTTGDKNTQARFASRKLGRRTSIAPFDLSIHEGEILGLAGLLGSGRTELARLFFGLDKPDQGELVVEGKKTSFHSPRHAMEAGVAFCPEDRKVEGIMADLSIRENIVLALQSKRGIFRYLGRKKQEELADHYIKALGIKTPGSGQLIRNLSGGNQQKVVLARWLATNPKLLILDEPTRGIDVGAKVEIQKLVMELAAEGTSIMFISSELEEVLRCSTRVAVLRDRRVIGEVSGETMSEGIIFRMIAQNDKESVHG